VQGPEDVGRSSGPERYRGAAIAALAIALGVAGVTAILAPAYRGLAFYGLYAIPAHLLISFLANEPALFAAARSYSAPLVAIAGASGCGVAIVLDYALIGWFVNRRLVRMEMEDSRVLRKVQRGFGRAPFVLILLSALLPVPFYPAKILAIARGYPLRRFVAALLLGRIPRFWLLAIVGGRLGASNSALGSFWAALALIGGWGIWRTVKRNRAAKQKEGA
jgi:membrane protein YqaA with SNARE-associated domain